MANTPPLPRSVLRLTSTLILGALALLLPACASGPDASKAGPPYPDHLKQSETLNIQVFKHSTTLELTNTTARSFGPSRLWLNRWNSRAIDAFPAGETLVLPLVSFRDEHGESFRPGGFFATEKPEKLVQAQLETDNTLLGLLVIGDPDEATEAVPRTRQR